MSGSINALTIQSGNLLGVNSLTAVSMISAPLIYCSTLNGAVANVDSVSSQTIKLSNGTNSCINIPILVTDPASVSDGNVWVFSSSGNMYLGVTSNNKTYYVIMAS